MRFMILVKANADTEAGVMPSSETSPPWATTTKP